VPAIAFCDRELLSIFVIAQQFRVQEKSVAAEYGDQHAKSVRSLEMSPLDPSFARVIIRAW